MLQTPVSALSPGSIQQIGVVGCHPVSRKVSIVAAMGACDAAPSWRCNEVLCSEGPSFDGVQPILGAHLRPYLEPRANGRDVQPYVRVKSFVGGMCRIPEVQTPILLFPSACICAAWVKKGLAPYPFTL